MYPTNQVGHHSLVNCEHGEASRFFLEFAAKSCSNIVLMSEFGFRNAKCGMKKRDFSLHSK